MSERGRDERLIWVDAVRGVGIVAVVAAHVWTRGAMRDAIYSFHMPLFFILSGYLSAPRPPVAFARALIPAMMRPYALFLLAVLALDHLAESLKGGRAIFHNWPADIAPVLIGGSELRGPFTIFWFVPCLLFARIVFNAALARWPDVWGRAWSVAIPVALALAYGLGAITDWSPLGLLSAPMAFALLWAGALFRRTGWRPMIAALLIPLSLCGLFLFPTINMKAGDYGWPILSIVGAVATSLLLMRACERLGDRVAWLVPLGQAALVIMYLHVAIIHHLTPYMGKVALFAVALALPFAVDRLIRRSPLASRWLL